MLDVDYYPRFIEIAWHNARRGYTNEIFARYGASEVIVSDNESNILLKLMLLLLDNFSLDK